jgi:hypothetical protein
MDHIVKLHKNGYILSKSRELARAQHLQDRLRRELQECTFKPNIDSDNPYIKKVS